MLTFEKHESAIKPERAVYDGQTYSTSSGSNVTHEEEKVIIPRTNEQIQEAVALMKRKLSRRFTEDQFTIENDRQIMCGICKRPIKDGFNRIGNFVRHMKHLHKMGSRDDSRDDSGDEGDGDGVFVAPVIQPLTSGSVMSGHVVMQPMPAPVFGSDAHLGNAQGNDTNHQDDDGQHH